jgi:hypothetical protein
MPSAADNYVQNIVNKYKIIPHAQSAQALAGRALVPLLQSWAAPYLENIYFSGSYAKGTAIRGATDIDLFISLSPATPHSLKEIYNNLHVYIRDNGKYIVRPQNVSLGITHGNLAIDLVPAKRHPGNTTNHSLYRNKADTWTQTNIHTHISQVTNSGRTREIIAIKIWRALHVLDFPSIYLELTVMEALKGKSYDDLANNVWHVLGYLSTSFSTARIVDPANTNNIISNDLNPLEKAVIANQAKLSFGQKSWTSIIW